MEMMSEQKIVIQSNFFKLELYDFVRERILQYSMYGTTCLELIVIERIYKEIMSEMLYYNKRMVKVS